MTKISRKDTKIFSENASNVNQFGSTRDGAAIPSKDPDVLQANDAFEEGWNNGVVAATDNPPRGEFNALSFLHSRALKYLEEQTLVEYSLTTTYFIDSIARTIAGTTLYKSEIDSNVNFNIAAAAYNAGTTYAEDDVAADTNGDVYRSLSDGNIGNALSNPTFWELVWVFLGDLADLNALQNIVNPNLIINGQGLIAQRGVTFDSTTTPANNNDTYLLDRMLLLSDGDDIVDVSQETTDVPQGSYSAIKFDQETVNKQWAYCQILESKDAVAIINNTASLSFKAKKGGSNVTLENLRAALISWDSTEDSVVSDVIGTWAGAGTNPTLATNWTFENIPSSNHLLTTSYQTFKVENINIDTPSTKNVALLIWLDDTDATVGDTAFITDIKVEKSSIATNFIASTESIEDYKCKAFFERIKNTGNNAVGYSGQVTTATDAFIFGRFILKRTMPVFSVSSGSGFLVTNAAGDTIPTITIATPTISKDSIRFDITVASGLVAGNSTELRFSGGSIDFDSEL